MSSEFVVQVLNGETWDDFVLFLTKEKLMEHLPHLAPMRTGKSVRVLLRTTTVVEEEIFALEGK